MCVRVGGQPRCLCACVYCVWVCLRVGVDVYVFRVQMCACICVRVCMSVGHLQVCLGISVFVCVADV